MKLQYDWLYIGNFKSIRELKFRISRPAGLYFVQGRNEMEPELESNGAGKSSIFDAICWLQFGKTADGLRGPDLFPWGTDAAPYGKLFFQRGGHKHILTRDLRGSPALLTLNKKDITQEHLEETLGYGFEVFCQSVYLAQSQPLFLELSRGEKLKLLSDAQQLDKWDRRAELANNSTRMMSMEIEREHGHIDAISRQIQELKDLHKQVQRQSEEWEAELARKQESNEKEIGTLREELEVLQGKYDEASLQYDGAMTELNAIAAALDELNNEVCEYDRQINQAEAKLSINIIESRKLERELILFSKNKCPTCGQAVHSKLPKPVALKKRLDELKKECDPVDIKKMQIERDALLDKQNEQRRSALQFKKKADQARAEMDMQSPRVAELSGRIQAMSKQQTAERNPFRDQMQQLRRKIGQAQTDWQSRTDAWRKKAQERERVEFWGKAFKDIKLDIVEELLQQLGMCCDVMLPRVGLHGWKMRFEIERETKSGGVSRGIDVQIIPYRRKANGRTKIEAWSGGEAQRLNLIAAMALSEVLLARAGVETNLQILDEPTQSLSPGGVDGLIEFLAEHVGRHKTVYFADQTARDSALFADSIYVVRGEGGSTVS